RLRGTSKVDVAAVLFDDPFRDPKAEPCAGVRLGGEEGLEELLANAGGNSGSVIGDREADTGLFAAGPAARGADANLYAAAGCDGIDAVAEQVRQDLANFARDSADLRVIADFGVDLHALIPRA